MIKVNTCCFSVPKGHLLQFTFILLHLLMGSRNSSMNEQYLPFKLKSITLISSCTIISHEYEYKTQKPKHYSFTQKRRQTKKMPADFSLQFSHAQYPCQYTPSLPRTEYCEFGSYCSELLVRHLLDRRAFFFRRSRACPWLCSAKTHVI